MQLDWNTISVVLGIVSIAIGFVYYRLSVRAARLSYSLSNPITIAEIPEVDGFTLRLLYTSPTKKRKHLKSIAVGRLRLENSGNIPIREVDISKNDPLRIRIEPPNVLLFEIKRLENGAIVELGQRIETDQFVEYPIRFEHLSPKQACIFQVTTAEREPVLSIEGTVIGLDRPPTLVDNASTKYEKRKFWTNMLLLAIFASTAKIAGGFDQYQYYASYLDHLPPLTAWLIDNQIPITVFACGLFSLVVTSVIYLLFVDPVQHQQ